MDTEREKLETYCSDIKEAHRLLEVAKKEFDAASTVRLERKHAMEEQQNRLNYMISAGPFAVEKNDLQLRLFDDSDLDGDDDIDDDDDEDGLIDELNVPAAIRVSLKKLGVETMDDLGQIIDGHNSTYPNGIDDLGTLDVDARKRVLAAFLDTRDDPDAENDSIPYSPPLPTSDLDAPTTASKAELKIKLKKDLTGTEHKSGDEIVAVRTSSGEVLVPYGDDDFAAVAEGEYALA